MAYPVRCVAALFAVAVATVSIRGQDVERPSSSLTGGVFEYHSVKGDSLASIGSRFGVDRAELATRNGLKLTAVLTPGQMLEVDNRHIVPVVPDGVSLVINAPQRMLFLDEGERVSGYPVAVGRRDWPTPLGDFTVVLKEEQPTWDVPESIQDEMRQQGRIVLERVPPGVDNPLGAFWLGLSIGSIGIHGTNAPASIFGYTTHGCVRMHPDDIKEIFPRVNEGTRGRIIYQPFLLARTREGILFEAHPDPYRQSTGDVLRRVREMAEAAEISGDIDWARVQHVLKRRPGVAVSVDRLSRTN